MTATLGLDIGGANLKAAHSHGLAKRIPFQLWKHPQLLTENLASLIRLFPPVEKIALTMTGELCDCFSSRSEGVATIMDSFSQLKLAQPTRIWSTSGEWLTVESARRNPLQVASANWHALATFAARLADGSAALLIDIGSTTTDLIPLAHGQPLPKGKTDQERFRSGELVYTGVQRTPVCGLGGEEVFAEFFATMEDVYLILGDIPDSPENQATADGKPATKKCARQRLARMIGTDADLGSEMEIRTLAQKLARKQFSLIEKNINKVTGYLPQPLKVVVLAGSGEFLTKKILANLPRFSTIPTVSLAEKWGPDISECACAYALTKLC